MVYKSTVAVPIRRNSHHLALTFSLKEIADFLQLYKPNTHLITPSRKGLLIHQQKKHTLDFVQKNSMYNCPIENFYKI